MTSDNLVVGVSVIVPVFNSEASLVELHSALTATLAECASFYEVILVDDCSRDRSWSVIQKIASGDPRVLGIHLNRNFGQHNALLCGIRAARCSTTVTLDDDLQNPPDQIPILLNKMDEGFDIVYGTPKAERHGLFRDSASRLTKLALAATLGADVAAHVSAFRAFRTPLREAFGQYSGPSVSIDILLSWASSNFGAVRVNHDPRRHGVSSYTFWKLVKHALNLVTGFGTAPLHLASILGFSFMLLGAGLLVYILVNVFVNGTSVPGFAFLASTIAVFSGVQLFSLGIFGEYLGRIYKRTMDQPSYFIGERAPTGKSD